MKKICIVYYVALALQYILHGATDVNQTLCHSPCGQSKKFQHFQP